jgi:hypothetical protein
MANTHKLYLHLMFDRPVGPGAVLLDARIESDPNPTIYDASRGSYHATLLHAEHGNPYQYQAGDRRLDEAENALIRHVEQHTPHLLHAPSLAALLRSRFERTYNRLQPLVGQVRSPGAPDDGRHQPAVVKVQYSRDPDDDGSAFPAYGKPPGVP